jgi:hypothetical protein
MPRHRQACGYQVPRNGWRQVPLGEQPEDVQPSMTHGGPNIASVDTRRASEADQGHAEREIRNPSGGRSAGVQNGTSRVWSSNQPDPLLVERRDRASGMADVGRAASPTGPALSAFRGSVDGPAAHLVEGGFLVMSTTDVDISDAQIPRCLRRRPVRHFGDTARASLGDIRLSGRGRP